MKLNNNGSLFSPTGRNDIKYIFLTLIIISLFSILSGLLFFYLQLKNKLIIDLFFILMNFLTIGLLMLSIKWLHKTKPLLFIFLRKRISFFLILKWIGISIVIFSIAFIILISLNKTKITFTTDLTILPLASSILYFVVVVLKEEIIFRSYLLQETSLYLKKVASILIVATLFAIYHIFKTEMYGLIIMFFWGLVYGWITFKYKRLDYVIAIHFGMNTMTWVIENILKTNFSKIFYFKLNILCLVFLLIIMLVIKKRASSLK